MRGKKKNQVTLHVKPTQKYESMKNSLMLFPGAWSCDEAFSIALKVSSYRQPTTATCGLTIWKKAMKTPCRDDLCLVIISQLLLLLLSF